MNNAVMLGVDDLGVRVNQLPLLRGVSFHLRAGQALTLLGESGAGKSLLAQAIMGTLPPSLKSSGTVTLAGRSTRADDVRERQAQWGRGLALLPQEPTQALDPLRRVLPQLQEVYAAVRPEPPEAAPRSVQARARAALDSAGLAHAGALYPWQISGGMAQRAAAAMALAGGAPVLLVDEPTKGLDAHWRERIIQQLQQVLQAGGCVVTITHDLEVAQALGGDLMVLCEGEVVEEGPSDAVLHAPAHAFTRRLIDATPARWPRRAPPTPGTCLLQARGLRKAFGGRILFEQLDMDLHQGERQVLQGPSGSGKSTLGNVLLGLLAPDAGHIQRSPSMGRYAIQKLYQDPVASFPEHISLGQSLRDVIKRHGGRWEDLENLLQRMKVSADLLGRRPGAVSGGELQRVALARVLSVRPKMLFADEPTSRLDLITQQETLAALLDAADNTGTALLLVTHDAALAEAVSARCLKL